MALDEADKKTIGEMIAAGLTKVVEQVGSLAGSMKTLTDGLGKTIGDAIDARVKPIEEKVGKPADDKDKSKDKDKPGADLAEQIKSAVAEATKPLAEFVSAKRSEEEKATAAAAAKVLVTKTLTEKKLGGLLKNEAVIARIVGTNPKDADAVMAAVETERSYAATFGVKPESFGADVSAEGGAPGSGGDKKSPEERKKATSEAIDKAAKAAVEVL